MATNPRSPTQKPKGWRKIIVNDKEYWWKPGYIRRASDRKQLTNISEACKATTMYWDHDYGFIWTPKVVANLIKHIEGIK